MTPDEVLHARICSRLVADTVTDCMIWTGAQTANGYGAIKVGAFVRYVHRAVYDLVVGDIPPGHLIRHLCHVKLCCQPAHLTPGTHQDNANDERQRRMPRLEVA